MIKISEYVDNKVTARATFELPEMAEHFIKTYGVRMQQKKPTMTRASVKGKAKRLTYKFADGKKHSLVIENVN